MADVQPLNALHYALDRVGGLPPVVAPPYDVIDAELRADLAARSPYNVVEIDLPEADGDLDPTPTPPTCSSRWQSEEILVRDHEPALWALAQDYTGPDGNELHAQAASSPACASRTTAPAASAPTSARTPARRRTACG